MHNAAMTTLKDLRLQRAWNQEDLAERAGVSRLTVVNLEAGRPCLPSTLQKIADALEMPVADLYEIVRPRDEEEGIDPSNHTGEMPGQIHGRPY